MNEILENLYLGDSQDASDFWITQERLYVTFNLEGWKVDEFGLDAEDVFFLNHLGKAIDDVLCEMNSPVLVHCHAGMDRSPFAVACYLVTEHGFDPRDAYKFVKERRPQTIIHDDWMTMFYNAWTEIYE